MERMLKAFVSRSFADEDEEFQRPLLDVIGTLIGPLQLELVDMKEAPAGGTVTDEVKDRIRECDFLIAVVTLRNGSIPGWIHQEMAFAAANGKPLVLYVEESIRPGELAAFSQHRYVAFNRAAIHRTYPQMLRALLHTIAQCRQALNAVIGRITVEIPRGLTRMQVHRLPPGNPLHLTWQTLTDGMRILSEQVKGVIPSLDFDLIVSVNQVGSMVAAHLDAALRNGTRPLGHIKTTAGASGLHKLQSVVLPEDAKPATILVADGLLKKGDTQEQIRKLLVKRYGRKVEIFSATMVACHVEPFDAQGRVVPVAELFERRHNRVFEASPACIPQFVAYVTEQTAQFPDGLR